MKRKSLSLLLIIYLIYSNNNAIAQSAEEWLKKGWENFNTKEYKEAKKCAEKCLKMDQKNITAIILKARSIWHLEAFKQAIEYLSEQIIKIPNNPKLLEQRSSFYHNSQQYEKGIEDVNLALDFPMPDSLKISCLNLMGSCKNALQHYSSAYKDLYEAYLIDSTYKPVINNLGVACFSLEKYEESEKLFFKIIAMDSTDEAALMNLGFSCQLQNKHNDAIKFFDKALKIKPDVYNTWNNIGFSKFKLGKIDEAILDIEHSLKLNPYNSYAYRNLALIYESKNDKEKLCENVKKALEYGFTKFYGNEVQDLYFKYCK